MQTFGASDRPWLSVQSIWTPDNQTLEDYLRDVGLPVVFVAGSLSRTAVYVQVTDDAVESSLSGLIGIRTAVVAPSYAAPGPVRQQSFRIVSNPLSVEVPKPGDLADELAVEAERVMVLVGVIPMCTVSGAFQK